MMTRFMEQQFGEDKDLTAFQEKHAQIHVAAAT
jgi:hypothetical protein